MIHTSRDSHTIRGVIPELGHILLRDNSTCKLELWTCSRGLALHSIVLQGKELEFVREVRKAVRVPDTEYNRKNCPNEIGRIFIDEHPLGVELREIE